MTRRLAAVVVLAALLTSLASVAVPGSAGAQTPQTLSTGVLIGGVIGGAGRQVSPSPESSESVCTPNTNVCFNQYASRMETRTLDGTTGPTYVVRANVNEHNLTYGPIAFRRAILIFTHRWDPDTGKYVMYLVAQAPFCYAADCYVEWLTRDRSEAAHAFWWGATIDKDNHALVARAGFPSA
jgi:hypothetical protein